MTYYYKDCWILDENGRWVVLPVPIGILTSASTNDNYEE